MNVVRAVAAVVVGYVLSQTVNGAFVYFWHVQDRSAPLVLLVCLTFVLFLGVGLLTGVVTARLGGPHALIAVRALAALIALVTLGNIIADVAAEPLWHKLIVLLIMAPAVLVVGSRSAVSDHAVD